MPETFTDERLLEAAEYHIGRKPDDQSIEKYRELFAIHIEKDWSDYVMGWEIRTGRPWDEMTPTEAAVLMVKHPETRGNLGVLSRFLSTEQ